jgi:hypothetical protein
LAQYVHRPLQLSGSHLASTGYRNKKTFCLRLSNEI